MKLSIEIQPIIAMKLITSWKYNCYVIFQNSIRSNNFWIFSTINALHLFTGEQRVSFRYSDFYISFLSYFIYLFRYSSHIPFTIDLRLCELYTLSQTIIDNNSTYCEFNTIFSNTNQNYMSCNFVFQNTFWSKMLFLFKIIRRNF